MKKILLFWVLALFILSSLPVQAKRVSVEKAEKAARSYAHATPRLTARQNFHVSHTKSRSVKRKNGLRSAGQEEPVYYVFTMNGEGGFVVISGDDAVKPVLGYSDTGTFDESNPNLAYWMETLSLEIAAAIENDLPQDAQTQAAWDALDNGFGLSSVTSGDYVEPLVETEWDQVAPYNRLCPQQRYTGCVATAMAQIMKYHEYPTTRTVTIPAYTTKTNKISVPAVTGTTNYDWNNMLDVYTSTSGTEAQKNAVATLMYHCGVGVKMDYRSDASGAYSVDVVPALINYFGYDTGIAFYRRDYYSDGYWIDLLKTELKAGRPVYYGGQGSAGGHAFVCDGYDTGGLFHFNWGWGGNSDGYFEVSALNPPALGAGGGSGGFNSDQEIITGIQPPTGSGGQPSIQLGLSGISAIKLLNTITMTAEKLTNIGAVTVADVYLGVILRKLDNSYQNHKTSKQTLGLDPGYYYTTPRLLYAYSLPSNLPAGTYKLYPAYHASSSSGIPNIIHGKNGDWYVKVTVNADGSFTLSNATNATDLPNLSLTSLYPAGNLYQNTTGNFVAQITNSGTGNYNSNMSLRLGAETVATVPVSIPAGAARTVEFSGTVTLSPGDYSLSVLYDPNNTSGSVPSTQLGNAVQVSVIKASQAAPARPEQDGKTAVSVTLKTIANAKYAKALSSTAPAISGGEWQDSPVFSGLTPNTTYYFFACYPETATHAASSASGGLEVVTSEIALSISVASATTDLIVGATTTLTATVQPDNAPNKTVSWASSNPAVATVSSGGANSSTTVTAVGAGTATITATAADNGNIKATCTVNVWKKGDANGNHSVNIGDISTIVACLLGQNPQPFIFEAADVNNSNSITIGDITVLIQIIYNK